jgi:hypothetical protein
MNAWECPRCHRMNASFTPSCGCSLVTVCGSTQSTNISWKISESGTLSPDSERCLVCNGYHGRGVQCIYLKFT